MIRFTLPRDLYHGKDALAALKTLTGKKSHDLHRRKLDEEIRIPRQNEEIS